MGVELAVAGAAALVLTAGILALKRRGKGDEPNPRELIKQLPPEMAGRYLELTATRDQVRKTIKEHGLEPVMGEQLRLLDTMVASYMRLAQEAARYRAYLQASPPGAIEKEIERTRQRLEATDNPDARATIQQNIAVLEKRHDKLQQIRDVAATLKSQLDTLEDTVHLIHEQAMTASAPEDIHVEADRVLAELAAAERALAETRGFLGTAQLSR